MRDPVRSYLKQLRDDHSSRPAVASRLKRRYPIAGASRTLLSSQKLREILPYSVLLRLWFSRPEGYPPAGGLLPRRFTLSYSAATQLNWITIERLFSFLWHFPSVTRSRR